jgi:hypothetical protein
VPELERAKKLIIDGVSKLSLILGYFTQDIFSGTGKGYAKDNPLI